MKKLLAIILLMVLSVTLVACGEEPSKETSTQLIPDESIAGSVENNSNAQETPVDDGWEYTPLNLNKAAEFVDGVAVVEIGHLTMGLINKQGRLLYSYDAVNRDEQYDHTDRCLNGYAIIADRVINSKGVEVASPEKTGYRYIWNSKKTDNMGKYIFVGQNINSYNYSGQEIGILDANGNWVLEMSKDSLVDKGVVLEDIQGVVYVGGDVYCIYHDDFVVFYNVETGESFSPDEVGKSEINNGWIPDYRFYNGYGVHSEDGKTAIINCSGEVIKKCDFIIYRLNKEIEYPEFGYVLGKNSKGYGYYDYSGNLAVDLSSHNISVNPKQDYPIFYDGYAVVCFENDAGVNFIGVVDKDGKLLFEPIEDYSGQDKCCKKVVDGYIYAIQENTPGASDYVVKYFDLRGNEIGLISEEQAVPFFFTEGLLCHYEELGYNVGDAYYTDINGNIVIE